MASLVYLKNKKNDVTYVYENISTWNKLTKKCDNTRTCIGKLDAATGELIPNSVKSASKKLVYEVKSFGNRLLLDHIADDIGMLQPLKNIFGDQTNKILTCAYQQLCENRPLSYIDHWQRTNDSPEDSSLTSQRVSELLPTIDRGKQLEFFKSWIHHRGDNEYLALDITSVSSYSEQNEFVRYGYNRDGENLPQINIMMLMGEKSHIPLFYDVLSGSIHDVSTLSGAIKQFSFIESKKLHLVMDKGFYSEKNVDDMYAAGIKFIIGVTFTSKFSKDCVDAVRTGIDEFSNYCNILGNDVFVKTRLIKWKNHRCYVHVYYDSAKADGQYRAFLRDIKVWETELITGEIKSANKKYYDKYFYRKATPVRGTKVEVNQQAIDEFKTRQAGYFILLSNIEKDPVKALEVYRNKDAVEKGFDDLKNTLDCSRLRVKSEASMQGRLFIQFISLILASRIRVVMKEYDMYKKYTMADVLDELKAMHRIKAANRKDQGYTKLTKTQEEILSAFGIDTKSYV